MRKRTDARGRDLARIHMLASQLGLDDATYRAVLFAQARVDSARDLDEHGRRQVIEHFENLLARGRKIDGTPPRNTSRPLIRKIAVQLAVSGKSWNYAAGIAKKMHGRQNLDWCSDAELHSIVAALAFAAKRHNAGKQTTTPREGP
jgi:phage gp16-like protein